MKPAAVIAEPENADKLKITDLDAYFNPLEEEYEDEKLTGDLDLDNQNDQDK
jgi:hypothetical protein